MPIRDAKPLMWAASGLTDSPNEFTAFPGACTVLENFIFSHSNRGSITCRPGVGADLTGGFAGFTTPGVVSCSLALGTRIYGMIGSGLNAGKDQPFCYDTATSAFVSISGITSGNSPTTQATSGAWTPPTMAVISTKIIVTHPGFNGSGSNYVGVIDISTPASPAWSSSNLTTNAFPSVPTWVAQFFNRAYYGCGNVVVFSDVFVPLTRTNASQSLTCGDTNATTMGAGLPITTATQGIIQALIIFKGIGQGIWQVTGDSALSTLALNQLSESNGTNAPWSVVPVPTGLAYMDADGIRLVSLTGQITFLNTDIVEPFINAVTPSRVIASYANSVYRICLDTVINGVTYTGNDYWYDFLMQRWSGPHTFPYNTAVSLSDNWYITSNTVGAKIFESTPIPVSNSIYTDNGVIYNSTSISATLNMESAMDMKAVIESTIWVAATKSTAYQITIGILDESMISAGLMSVNANTIPAPWGSIIWNAFTWTLSKYNIATLAINWTAPVVFSTMSVTVTLPATQYVEIKQLLFRIQPLNRTMANV